MKTQFKRLFENWINNILVNPKTGKIVRLDGIFNYLRYQDNTMYDYINGVEFDESLKLNEKMY